MLLTADAVIKCA